MKPLALLAALLVIPLIPFLIFGSYLESEIPQILHRWLQGGPPEWIIAASVVTLLTVDVLLPIPSSVVCSLAGSLLGLFGGILFSTLGLTAGALLGFLLGRCLGRPAVLRWMGEAEWQKIEYLVSRYGVAILLILRPVPLFAEASTLLLGCSRLRVDIFLMATLPIHLMLATVFVALGYYLNVTLGMILSVVIALLLSWAAKLLIFR